MFTVVHGNRLEDLAHRLAALLAEDPPPPLVPEVVVVQSAGMARWLSLHLARTHGIAANVRFPLPAAFLWQTFRALVPGTPDSSPLDPRVAVWHIRAILDGLEEAPLFEPLHAYLRQTDERGRHELAGRIADLFDQYLVYRPDWIGAWESGEGDGWQPAIWRQLVARTSEPHRVRVQAAAMAALAAGPAPGVLPPRVAVFGIPTMPPAYLAVFRRLAERTPVRLFRLSPSREYWDRPRTLRPEEGTEPGHPLLASLGRQGRDFVDLLLEVAPDREEERWIEPGDDSALHTLQMNLLTLRDRTGRAAVAADDRSLQLHVCHTPMREIEVLHDQLHWLFECHPDLGPADVVVMTPDIDAYAPCVEAVFGGAQGARHIPWSLADRSLRAESPLITAYLGLLELPGGRYPADRLLALLDVPAVHRRFGLEPGDLELAQRLVREGAVRWGVDAAMRERLGLPATREHTWRFGLDRLLLGYALPGTDRGLRGGVPPCDAVEGSDAQVLGRLAAFVEATAALEDALAVPRPMAAWVEAFDDVLTRCLASGDGEEDAIDAIRVALRGLAADAARAGYDAPLPLDLARALLEGALAEPVARGRFLAGGVTFCAMVPMRSIPFQVVCLVGMNDGSFPRARQPLSFDLLAADDPRPGDRSRRDDDRWLFLEAVASARRCLYVSWVGRGVRDNAAIPPSIVVSELRAAIERGFDAPHLETVHPLQAFSPKYFEAPPAPGLVSYSTELCEATRRRGRGRRVVPLLTSRLPDAAPEAFDIDLERFAEFFVNPTAHLLRERLGIRLAEAAQPVEFREPFCLDALGVYALRAELLGRRSEATDSARLLPDLRGRGLLPIGRVGEIELAHQRAVVDDFAARVEAVGGGEVVETVPVDVRLGRVRISGTLQLAADGLVGFRLAAPKPRDLLRLWVRHLLLHVAQPRPDGWRSRWLGTTQSLLFGPVGDAERLLRELADAYDDGLHRLLPFFPRTALRWCEAETRQRERAREAWEGNEFSDGERMDVWFAYGWREVDPIGDEFETLAARLMAPLLAHCTESDT